MDKDLDVFSANGIRPASKQQGAQQAKQPSAAPHDGDAGSGDGGGGGVHLKRSLGLRNGVSMIIGVIVGSGIFVAPKGVLAESGSVGASLLVWSLCGLFALLGALCFAELGASVPTSGGDYAYIKLAYGPLPAFLYLWVYVLVTIPCSNAIAALTFANYVLQPFYSGCAPPEHATRLLAFAVLLLLVYVNCVSVRASSRLQDLSLLPKVLALTVIISFGLYYLLAGRAPSFDSSHAIWFGTQTSASHLAQAFYASFYTYSGWNSLNCVTEELKDPVKNMPRAIILSITSITLIYILANAAYFAVLTRPEILESGAIAVTFGERTLPLAGWLMPLAVALSTVGGLNGGIFTASRVLFAGARQGQLFSALHMINPNHLTPIPSLIFLGLVSSFYLVTTEIIALMNYTIFVEASFAALSVSTVLMLRYKMPELERPLKISLIVPILYLLFSVLLILLPIWTAPVEATIGVLLVLTGLPAYYLSARWSTNLAGYQRAMAWFNQLTQKLTFSVIPDEHVSLE